METSYTYTEDGKCWFSSDERKTINRILKLKEKYPDEVAIRAYPENNDGCIYGIFPCNWVKIAPPVKMELTDEERAKRAESLRKARAAAGFRKNKVESGVDA